MFQAPRQRVASGPAGRAGGFTLVELLLVMFIMAVLVALVVGVGSTVIEEGRKSETRNHQERLLAAIDAFRKVTGDIPPDTPDPNNSISELVKYLQGASGIYEARVRTDISKETRPFLGTAAGGLQLDAFNKPMRYYSKGGLGGGPVIISAGPDGEFGDGTTTRAKQLRVDNIRSDTKD